MTVNNVKSIRCDISLTFEHHSWALWWGSKFWNRFSRAIYIWSFCALCWMTEILSMFKQQSLCLVGQNICWHSSSYTAVQSANSCLLWWLVDISVPFRRKSKLKNSVSRALLRSSFRAFRRRGDTFFPNDAPLPCICPHFFKSWIHPWVCLLFLSKDCENRRVRAEMTWLQSNYSYCRNPFSSFVISPLQQNLGPCYFRI